MKSLRDMFRKALSILSNESSGTIAFICTGNEYLDLSANYVPLKPFEFSCRTRSIYNFGRGKIQFFMLDGVSLWHGLSGFEFTHVFITRPHDLDEEIYMKIKGKVRTTKKLVEPSGVYLPYGVERLEDY